MKIILITICIIILNSNSFTQEDLVVTQAIFIGQVNVDTSRQTTFTITSQELLWTADKCFIGGNTRFPLTNNSNLVESSVSLTGNSSCSSLGDWPGWVLELQKCNWEPMIGYGLYLVGNNYTGNYFYLDTRDCDWGDENAPGGYNPDFWIMFNPNSGFFYNSDPGDCSTGWTFISDGSTKTVWDIENGGTSPDTDCFETWSSYLRIASVNNRPKLVWSPNPDDPLNYEIYRAVTNEPSPPPGKFDYELLTTVSNSTLSYIDYDFTLGGSSHKAYYYIQAKFTSPPHPTTVTVNTYVLYYKEAVNKDDVSKIEYSLSQNYPNPFNSNTIIKYAIHTDSYVELKIFNIMGQEIQTLIEKYQTAGDHGVEFNAENLVSGIYYYRIRSNDFMQSRKLILIR
jgi:hypothetical protein